MTQDDYRDRQGKTIPAHVATQLLSHLRLDEIATLLEATAVCKTCCHLYLFHDPEGYEACQVEDCECAEL